MAGNGLVLAASIALISVVLHLLVGWPELPGVVAACASAVVPLALIAAEWPPLARHGGRSSCTPSRPRARPP